MTDASQRTGAARRRVAAGLLENVKEVRIYAGRMLGFTLYQQKVYDR